MADHPEMLLGEFVRVLDDRFRLSLPPELADGIAGEEGHCLLAKERAGCVSLWRSDRWQRKHQEDLELLWQKLRTARLEGRLGEVQAVGRLLSTRQKEIQLAARSRMVIPEGFRELLGVETGGSVMVIGAIVCVELWHPQKWKEQVDEKMPDFRSMFEQLVG